MEVPLLNRTTVLIKRMKKIFLIFLLIGTAFANASAQRFGYVDTEYILDLLPEYRSAQKQLEQFSADWEKEIEKKQAVIEKMYRDYNAEQVLLTEDLKKRREQEISDKEKDLKEYRNAKFGFEGELFKKRQELIKPIQDRVFEAVQKVAKQSALDFIFAKGSEMIMLFANAKYDKSDEVLAELGVAVTGKKDNKQPTQQDKNKK